MLANVTLSPARLMYCVPLYAPAFCSLLGDMARAVGSMTAAALLHKVLLSSCLHSPLEFFDTTPVGRVVNRFSKDVDSIDVVIPKTMQWFFRIVCDVLGTLVVISYSTPLFLAVSLPLVLLYYFIQVHPGAHTQGLGLAWDASYNYNTQHFAYGRFC